MARAPLAAERQNRYAHYMRGGILNHEDWLKEMREVTRLMDEDMESAAAQLRKVLQQTEAARKLAVSSWHLRQSMSLLAEIEIHRGDVEAAAQVDEEAADQAAHELRELQHASAYRYASAALYRFKLDQNDRAMVLAEKALSLVDTYADPSETYERLVREVRRVREARSQDGA